MVSHLHLLFVKVRHLRRVAQSKNRDGWLHATVALRTWVYLHTRIVGSNPNWGIFWFLETWCLPTKYL